MKNICFALFDRKLGRYDIPRFARDDKEAIALFSRAIESDAIPIKFAADYDLYKLGDFDDKDGSLTNDLVFLVNGSDFVKSEV